MSEILLSKKAVREILGISDNTLGRYRREGKIKCIALSPRAIRFRTSDVEAFIAAQTMIGNTPAQSIEA